MSDKPGSATNGSDSRGISQSLSRRQLLAGLGALGAGLLSSRAAGAAGAGSVAGGGGGLIDVHHHMIPAAFMKLQKHQLLRVSEPQPAVMQWTPEHSLADMDAGGTRTAIISIVDPGVWVGNAANSRALAREVNRYGAQLKADHPGRFGFFAALPMPDVDGSLSELAYAMDTLGADGVGFFSDTLNRYPGDPRFAPIFDELNRRKTVAYFHPMATDCAIQMLPRVSGKHRVTAPIFEFPFDTTRAICSFLYAGTFERCPDITFIFAHGGGTLPMLAGRICQGSQERMSQLKRLNFDTASVTNPPAMAAVLKLVPATQVFFGTDYPWGRTAAARHQLQSLGLADEQLAAIEFGNGQRAFPRLHQAG
ncbi:MAG TPA: amidohydrolase family protein [Candidatus Binataceae bacterium]|nr:amidohydrolase family protein [Candidatus Binataceae bacterium]